MVAFLDPKFFFLQQYTIKNVNLMLTAITLKESLRKKQKSKKAKKLSISIYSRKPTSRQQQYAATPLRCLRIKCKLQIRHNLS